MFWPLSRKDGSEYVKWIDGRGILYLNPIQWLLRVSIPHVGNLIQAELSVTWLILLIIILSPALLRCFMLDFRSCKGIIAPAGKFTNFQKCIETTSSKKMDHKIDLSIYGMMLLLFAFLFLGMFCPTETFVPHSRRLLRKILVDMSTGMSLNLFDLFISFS